MLLLRLEGPLMSFGGVRVDERNVTDAFPGSAMLTGMLGNALGWHHRDFERLQRLQARLRHAARRDRRGRELVDYQTVDLGHESLQAGWTTWGVPSERAGSLKARTGTHIRYRAYWADAVVTVALTLHPADEEPDLDRCRQALDYPRRPLFLGRKACPPARPLVLDLMVAPSLYAALSRVPLSERADPADAFPVQWPELDGEPTPSPDAGRTVPATDLRDWLNQVHAGRRFVHQGRISVEARADGS